MSLALIGSVAVHWVDGGLGVDALSMTRLEGSRGAAADDGAGIGIVKRGQVTRKIPFRVDTDPPPSLTRLRSSVYKRSVFPEATCCLLILPATRYGFASLFMQDHPPVARVARDSRSAPAGPLIEPARWILRA